MIQIIRDRTAIPAAFRPPGSSKNETSLLGARLDHLIRLQSDPKAGHGYSSSWWKAAKKQLIKESHGKCAYCESGATAISYGDVEHFRPKASWWWLTCSWENYLFSCQLCNQQYKGENFPIAGTMTKAPVKITAATASAALAALVGKLVPDPQDGTLCDAAWKKLFSTEKPGLIDPNHEDPEAYFAYQADEDKGLVTVIPRSNGAQVKRRVADCIQYYGLNREELCELRYDLYDVLVTVRDSLEGMKAASKTRVLKSLERRVASKKQFAGMCRYFLIDDWGLLSPDLRA